MTDRLAHDALEGPTGPQVGAFFDFDGTLIDGYSAATYIQDRARRNDMTPAEAARLVRVGLDTKTGRADFDRFMRVGVQSLRGHHLSHLSKVGDRLLRGSLGGLLYPEMLELLAAHRRRGHTIVIATSALPFQVEPMARELGIEHILCTRLERVGDVLTGRVEGPILWGPGKAAAVRRFAGEAGIDLEVSYAYGNGGEDVEFLRTVGHPRPVNPKPALAEVAAHEAGFGQIAQLANMALVDRADGTQARAALQPVVERLREGYSIAIAPEGTRSPTPTVGPFKKGAFHMAMQGGVPIVPVVIRNAGELLWRGSKVIRPGTVDVHVLEPISVAGWTRKTLGDHVAEVRELFVRTLEDWPADA